MTPLAQNTLCICGKADCSIIYGTCHCSCGQATVVSPKNDADWGFVKGMPRKYKIGHQRRKIDTPEYHEEDRGYKTPCWIWDRCLCTDGYGLKIDHKVFGGDGRQRLAHILYWEKQNGKTPVGHELHHKCEIRKCVNPDHLDPVTRLEHRRLRNLEQKTHCPRGRHELNESNSRIWQGRRVCNLCKRKRKNVSNSITAYRSGEPLSCDPPQEPERT